MQNIEVLSGSPTGACLEADVCVLLRQGIRHDLCLVLLLLGVGLALHNLRELSPRLYTRIVVAGEPECIFFFNIYLQQS